MSRQSPLKILYGVQATGQGHISRAKILGRAMQNASIDVDFLFSGRPREEMYGMEAFGKYAVQRGLTFEFNKGKVSPAKTLLHNNVLELLRDARRLDLSGYDLVLTDYEPVTAWAAKLRGVPSIGIGNQYAYKYKIPQQGFNAVTLKAMQCMAPADVSFGIHWHHFNQPLLPPISLPLRSTQAEEKKIVVYMNNENVADLAQTFEKHKSHHFHIYSSQVSEAQDAGNVRLRPASPQFRQDLETASGVICSAGFELPTEVMQLGRKLLVKPMANHPEQQSNVLAIRQLGIGHTIEKLDHEAIAKWLAAPQPKKIIYPDTARALTDWILHTKRDDSRELVDDLWRHVEGLPLPTLK